MELPHHKQKQLALPSIINMRVTDPALTQQIISLSTLPSHVTEVAPDSVVSYHTTKMSIPFKQY